MNKTYLLYPILILLAFLTSCTAQETNKTMSLEKGAVSPPATLADVAWIAGTWKGKAFGGDTEEIWSEPLGNSMMASFKLVVDGVVQFYELEIITEKDNSLLLQLKHFGGDLKGWEPKDETVDFPLVKIEKDRVFFDGMTFEKVSENEMNVYVLIGGKDGTAKEEKFNYRK